MISTIKIKRISITDANQKGEPYINPWTKKPQKRIGVQTESGGDKWLSDFISNPNDPRLSWQIGDEQKVIIEQKGDFWNFKLPDKSDLLEEEMEIVKKRLTAVEQFMMK